MLDAQSAAAAEFKPGMSTIASLNQAVRDVFRTSSLRAKDEDGVERSMDHFFIHGLGHHLGMDVHDVGDAPGRSRPGEVFTIEPGLYLPPRGSASGSRTTTGSPRTAWRSSPTPSPSTPTRSSGGSPGPGEGMPPAAWPAPAGLRIDR